MSSNTADGADAGVEAAVRVSQGYCIYAGCFPVNIIPPLSFAFDLALTGVAARVPAVGTAVGRGGAMTQLGITRQSRLTGMTKVNTGTAWMMGDALGAPWSVGEAADKWFQAAEHLGNARAELEGLMWSLSSDQWSGDDREAFDREVAGLARQIGDAQQFAQIVGGSLIAGVVPLGVWPIGCAVVGVIQFVNASLFYAAAASIVGNLGPSPALYASGLATSITCNRVLRISLLVIQGLMVAAAAVIAGGALDNAGDQEANGDEDARADLQRAVVEMAVEQAVKDLAASGIDALTPLPLDVADHVARPGEYLGLNNDAIEDGVDDRFGDGADDLGDRAGEEVVGDDRPDRGPFSAG